MAVESNRKTIYLKVTLLVRVREKSGMYKRVSELDITKIFYVC